MKTVLPAPRSFLALLLASVLLLVSGCGSAVPKPETGPHPRDAYVEVPYPPPAAVAEVVPEQPDSAAVWTDGQWTWRGRYFVWQRGAWVIPPRDAYFAPWTRFYGKDGALFFADGTWRAKKGRKTVAPPPVLKPALTPGERETPETLATP